MQFAMADPYQRSKSCNTVSRFGLIKSKLALEPIMPFTEAASVNSMYSWVYDYDADFLGYMAGVLKLDDFFVAGGGVI